MGLPQDVIERTVEEFVAAIRAGMSPSLESFCRRHQHDDELRKVLLAAKMIELAKVPAAPGPGPSQSQMTIPPRLDGYRLISEIGKGGMGVVYRAEDETLGRHVALKVISPEFLHQNGRATVARFAVEAKIEANLQHSNIVQIYGFGRDQGIHYISMQLVDGLPLSEVWKQLSSARTPEATEQQPTEPSQTPETATAAVEITRMLLNGSFTRGADHTSSVEHLRILDEASSSNGTISKAGPRSREYVCKIAGIGAQVADALQYAHQRGITHRDIKPGNLLLDPTGNVWVADFGLACRKNLNPPTAGAMEGSLRYMAPEQFFGESDARSDIYSLGITLHELLTLERSFEAATVSELKAVIRRQELKVPVDRVRIPADLRSIIRKSIAPDASRRYSSARELKTDLERFLEGVPVQARKLNFVERTYRWCKRRPVQALAVCLLLTVCILASAVASVSTIAARTQKELREDAERLRYLSEIGVTFLQYQELLGDSQSPAVTEYSARSRLNDGAVYSPRLAPASVSSWETAWLEQFSPQRPTLIGRLAKGDWGVVDLEVNADGEFAVSVDESGLMLVWNLATGQPVRSLIQGRSRTKPEQSVHHYLSREQDSSVADWGSCYVDVEWIDDRRIASASLDGSGTVFDVTTGEQLLVFSANEALYSVAAGLDQLLFGDAVGGLSLRSHDGKEVTALKTENGATTDLHWLAGHGRWLAGFENGKVVLLDAQSLEVLSELRVAAPVWSIDAIEKGTDALVVVGGNSSIPELARVTANGLEITERLEPPLSAEGSDALHQVSFAQGGKIILGGNGRGYLTQWDIESKVPSWTARVAGRDPRNRRVERLVTEQTGEPLPIIFDRRIAAIREVSNGGPIITAGEDLTIKIWDTPQDRDRSGMAVRLTQKVGKHPDIAFDSTREGRLWGIGEDGILHLLDVKLDRTVATRRAHVGGIVGMAIAKGSDIVATVGGDNHIRLWRAGEDTIVGAGIGSIDHSATLISVAVTENGEFVAAVDADARLGVWRINDGEQVFLTELKASIHQGRDTGISHPLTGRVAFNRDGSLLAAFGIGQSGYLFAAAPYRRLPMQMRIAGAGGTALLWNPRHRDVVFAADNHPRYATTAVDRDLRYLEEQPVVARQSCMAMEATSDSRRIVCLEKGGRVVFMETERHFQLLEFTHPRGLDSDLSLDASGKRLALAGQGGAVEILQIHAAEDTRISHRDDRSERWVMRDLVSPTALIPRADGRSIAFDSRGRLNMLLTLSRSQDFQLEGELHFLRSDGTSLVRERLIVDGTVNDRRFELQSTDLAIAPNDEPMIVFRRRTAVQNDYDGCFYSARRAGSDDWEFSIIHSHGNLGFYPILTLSPNGRVVEVLHFDFDGYKLCRSFPNGTELEHWDLEYLGRVGDGFRMQHARSDDESIHSLFSWNPVNGLQTPRIYSRYAKGKYTREIVDPFSAIDNPRVGPDGSVFVKARKATRTYVLQRGKKGWQEHSELPKGTGSFEVLSNGEMYFGPQWDADAGEILLWHKAGDDWNLEVIAAGLFALEPSWLQLLLDDRDRPAVMFGRLGEPNGWIKLLTVR